MDGKRIQMWEMIGRFYFQFRIFLSSDLEVAVRVVQLEALENGKIELKSIGVSNYATHIQKRLPSWHGISCKARIKVLENVIIFKRKTSHTF